MKEKQQRLYRVEEHMDQLISATAEWLALSAQTPEQLVLSLARIRELRELQKILHKHVRLAGPKSEFAWIIVKALVSTILSYVLQLLGNSINYNLTVGISKFHFATNAHGMSLEY